MTEASKTEEGPGPLKATEKVYLTDNTYLFCLTAHVVKTVSTEDGKTAVIIDR